MLCIVTDARPEPEATSYSWWMNGLLLNENERSITRIADHTQHNGIYTCAASNIVGMGNMSKGYDLRVYCKFLHRLELKNKSMYIQ